MKGLGLVAAFAMVLVAAPVFAGDVSSDTLAALGLGNMQAMSDVEGMQVRGMSSNAVGAGVSTVVFQLAYNDGQNTGSLIASDTNMSQGSEENGGASIVSDATSSQGSGAGTAVGNPFTINDGTANIFVGSGAILAGTAAIGTAGVTVASGG